MKRLAAPFLGDGLYHLALLCTLLVLLTYTVAFFVYTPYAGFDWTSGEGRISDIYIETVEPSLQINDRILQIGEIRWEDFKRNFQDVFFGETRPGDIVPLRIERNGAEVQILWRFPGWTLPQWQARMVGTWWMPFVFWLLALFTFLGARPRDTRWRLLIAFDLSIAVWAGLGGGSAEYHTWYSAGPRFYDLVLGPRLLALSLDLSPANSSVAAVGSRVRLFALAAAGPR